MPVPGDIFLAVVDILLAHDLAELEKNMRRRAEPDAGSPAKTVTGPQREPSR